MKTSFVTFLGGPSDGKMFAVEDHVNEVFVESLPPIPWNASSSDPIRYEEVRPIRHRYRRVPNDFYRFRISPYFTSYGTKP